MNSLRYLQAHRPIPRRPPEWLRSAAEFHQRLRRARTLDSVTDPTVACTSTIVATSMAVASDRDTYPSHVLRLNESPGKLRSRNMRGAGEEEWDKYLV